MRGKKNKTGPLFKSTSKELSAFLCGIGTSEIKEASIRIWNYSFEPSSIFPEKEVLALRKEIGEQMYKYNFDTMLWEWANLGLPDVLAAMRPKLNKLAFEEFYWRAMEIEQRNS